MRHSFAVAFGLIAAAGLAWTQSLPAQERGDAERGARIAQQVCIACHGIRPGENSVHSSAPPFAKIAATRGMSPMALNVALLTPHREMPNIVLDARERADIVAYILGMK